MKRITLAALLLSLCIAHATPAYTNAWDVDLPRNPHTIIDVWRGESIALTARTGLAGLPDDAEFRWQTPDMGNLFWVTNAAVNAAGDMTVEWLPEMDSGSTTYFFFFRGGGIYRPRGTIRMQGSPGAEPNTLPLPGRTLDFATITVTNAPWATPADIDAAIDHYADQAASSAVTAHNSSASAHASLFSGLASETWVTATRAKCTDIATNVTYQVVVSNGHWLIKEVQ